MDALLTWAINHGDLSLVGDDLATDEGLNTAVILSLFCDARAAAGEVEPGTDPRGWWGDTFAAVAGDATGSKLWLLGREKQLPAVLQRAKGYAEDALAWLITDGVAASVNVTAEFLPSMAPNYTIALGVEIARPHGGTFNRQFQYVWSAYQ